jgi:hypothetical protein
MRLFSNGIRVSIILLLSLAALAKAKQYEVVVNHPVQAGNLQLKPGKYQLELEGGTATFYQRNKEVGKIQVKTEESSQKAEVTRMGSVDDKVTSIELGGTKTKLTPQ